MILLFFSPPKQMAIFCNDDNYRAPKGLKTHSLAYSLLTCCKLTSEKKDYLLMICFQLKELKLRKDD